MAVFLVGVFCFSLAACGDGEAESILENADTEGIVNTIANAVTGSGEEAEDEEEYELEIPDSITNISPEEDKAVTGILTEDSYTNEYFGFKLKKVEGGEISSVFDEGTDLMLLSEAYANGYGSVYIRSYDTDFTFSINASVSALASEEQGKTEKDLTQEKYDFEQDMNESMEYEADCSVETIRLAGEEHPAYVEIAANDDGVRKKTAYVYIVKGDFECSFSISGEEDKFEDLLGLIEKI